MNIPDNVNNFFYARFERILSMPLTFSELILISAMLLAPSSSSTAGGLSVAGSRLFCPGSWWWYREFSGLQGRLYHLQ